MAQILHRDIKPSNIFLDADAQARLGDLGLARQQRPVADNVTTMTSIAGTNGFIDDHYQVLLTLIRGTTRYEGFLHIFDQHTQQLDDKYYQAQHTLCHVTWRDATQLLREVMLSIEKEPM
jgi:serine/threonine protein kinase